jgi:hypothetical protein
MLRFGTHRPAGGTPTAAARLLGADHPYVVADGDARRATQTLVLTAAFVAASAAFADPAPRRALMTIGTFVLLVLVLRVVLASDVRRQCALDLVLAGHEALPIPAVARLRRSLLGPRRDLTVELLDRSLADAVARAEHDPATPPLPIVAVRDDVAEIVELLRSTRSARAVAMTACLLQGGEGWSLLTRDQQGLRRELGRIRYLLASEEAAAPPVVWLAQ